MLRGQHPGLLRHRRAARPPGGENARSSVGRHTRQHRPSRPLRFPPLSLSANHLLLRRFTSAAKRLVAGRPSCRAGYETSEARHLRTCMTGCGEPAIDRRLRLRASLRNRERLTSVIGEIATARCALCSARGDRTRRMRWLDPADGRRHTRKRGRGGYDATEHGRDADDRLLSHRTRPGTARRPANYPDEVAVRARGDQSIAGRSIRRGTC